MKPTFPEGTIFAVDFDGTCVTHEFPKIGQDCPHAIDVLKMINKSGGKIILWTMRSNHTKKPIVNESQPISNNPIVECNADEYLNHAKEWFSKNGIDLWGCQCNPEQQSWTTSPKAYAHKYIDDAAIGCPLLFDVNFSDRPYVDWLAIKSFLFTADTNHLG